MRTAVILLLLSCPVLLSAQAGNSGRQANPATKLVRPSQQWQSLIDAGHVIAAEKLCSGWVAIGDHEHQVEAQKCLANVELLRGSQLSISGNEVGGGNLGEGYKPEAIDAALKHLNEGLRIAPQDISIHEGRLHVLEVAGRFDEMAKAMEESIETYKGPGAPGVWLAYCPELADMGFPSAGLKISEVLAKNYPNDPDVLGNVGAFHNMLKQWDQGLPYIRRAMQLRPNDPIDTWNLGWTLNHLGQLQEADKWMAKSIELGQSSDLKLDERRCLYGKFEVDKMARKTEGCTLVDASCDAEDRKECDKVK